MHQYGNNSDCTFIIEMQWSISFSLPRLSRLLSKINVLVLKQEISFEITYMWFEIKAEGQLVKQETYMVILHDYISQPHL